MPAWQASSQLQASAQRSPVVVAQPYNSSTREVKTRRIRSLNHPKLGFIVSLKLAWGTCSKTMIRDGRGQEPSSCVFWTKVEVPSWLCPSTGVIQAASGPGEGLCLVPWHLPYTSGVSIASGLPGFYKGSCDDARPSTYCFQESLHQSAEFAYSLGKGRSVLNGRCF